MRFPLVVLALLAVALPARAELPVLQPADIFQLQWASDPQVAPGGERVVYVRNQADIMADRYRQNLWLVDEIGRASCRERVCVGV
mgnify:CR=1 FL=1